MDDKASGAARAEDFSREPFLFVSHANADKENPIFLALMRWLVFEGDIPVGIDTPAALDAYGLSESDFAWSLARHIPYSEEIKEAIAGPSCATLVVLSRNYLEETTAEGGIPYTRWQEMQIATARAAQQGSAYKVFYVWLEDLSAHPKMVHELKSINAARPYLGQAYVEALESDIGEHFTALRHQYGAPTNALRTYLQSIVQKYERVPLFGFRKRDRWLPLEQIYAALRGNLHVAAEERASAYLEFQDALVKYDIEGEENYEEAVRSLIVSRGISHMRGLGGGTDYDAERPAAVGLPLSLADATRTLRRVVILGGPGCGKSTLAQWLALTYARGLLTDPDAPVSVPLKHVDPESNSDDPVVIGAPRVPVLLRIQEYAEAYVESGFKLPIIDFIGKHDWRPPGVSASDTPVAPEALLQAIKEEAARGRLAIILDGLDEVIDPKVRRRVLAEIEALDIRYIRSDPCGAGYTGTRFGNQLIVTSRIVGYDSMPLPINWRHVTIEEMSEKTVSNYWLRLFSAISDDKELSSVAEDVKRLCDQVFSGADLGTARLATVPLLATIIAAAYDDGGRQSLPEYRVEIYEKAVQVLVEQWRETGVSADEWSKVLAPIAFKMHNQPGESMLKESELRRELSERLAEMHALSSEAARREAVDLFMLRVNREVGLLAARRPGVFAFLHRSFQEYLAAQWLVEKPALAFNRVRHIWRSPRWRNVVLLAFGWTGLETSRWSTKDRNDLVLRLLRQTQSEGLTQALQVLADAVAEMPGEPPAGAITALFSALAIETVRGAQDQGDSNTDFEDACAILAGRAPQEIAKTLAGMLAGDAQSMRAAATVLFREGWSAKPLTDALEEAEPRADRDTALLIEACLRAAAQLDPAQAARRPTRAVGLSRDKEIDLARIDASGFRQYRQDMAAAAVRYQRELKRYGARTALGRGDHYRRRTPAAAAAATSAARAALETDFGWQAVFAGLFGGIDEIRAMAGFVEYGVIARFLSKSDSVRQSELAHRAEWRERFGGGDTVYAMAVALDTGVVDGKSSRKAPRFNPDWAVGAAAPPANLAKALSGGEPSNRLVKSAFRQIAASSDKARMAFACVLADRVGELTVREVVGKLSEPERAALAEHVRGALAGIGDASFRGLHAGHSLGAIEKSGLEDPARSFSARVAIETGVRLHPSVVFPIDGCGNFDDAVQAEAILIGLSGQSGDNVVYNIIMLLGTQGEKIRGALERAPEAAVAPWLERCSSWPVAGYSPRMAGRFVDDVPLPLEDIIDTCTTERIHFDLRGMLYEVVCPARDKSHPDFEGALITRALDIRFLRNCLLARSDAPEAPAKTLNVKAMAERVRKIATPYYRARALATLALVSGQSGYSQEAYEAAERIADAEQKALVMERLGMSAQADLSKRAAKQAVQAAMRVGDKRDAWRLRMRLAHSVARARGGA